MTLTIAPVADNEPRLMTSPLIRGVLKTADYIDANGGIGLTKSGAFNRKFVHWAAAHFDWPGYSEEELYAINKVLNETDFPPVEHIHALLAGLRLGRRWKGKFRLTKSGRALIDRPGRLLSELVPDYLFRLDHGYHLPFDDQLPGSWDIFLNVINIEADRGCDLAHLRAALYGPPDTDRYAYDRIGTTLYLTVLRPLCWAGLLQSDESTGRSREALFYKTELWRRYVRLRTDQNLNPPPLH